MGNTTTSELDDEIADDDEITDADREYYRQQRINFIEYEGRVRSTPCERCGAQVGQPCFTPKYYTTQYHKVRRVFAGVG